MAAVERLAHRKRIGGSGAGRIDTIAGEQASDDHRFLGVSRGVSNDNFFLRVMRIRFCAWAHSFLLLEYYCANRASKSILFSEMPQATSEDENISRPTQDQIDDETRRIRRLRILVQLTIESIAAGDLTPEEAAGMVAATRRVALEMFPGKERAFDLLYRPKFQRVMHAVYRLQ